jgi:hypothetical protein
VQGPEGRPPNVSPARKGWEIDPEEDPSAVGAALNRSSALPVSLGAYPDFLLHSSHRCYLCGSPQREPHAAVRSRNSRQEIRGSRPVPACRGGICSSADPSWKCFSTGASKAVSSSLTGSGRSPGYPVFDPVVLSHYPHSWLCRAPSCALLLQAQDCCFLFATLVANSLTRSVAPVTTPLHCYILIPEGKLHRFFPGERHTGECFKHRF